MADFTFKDYREEDRVQIENAFRGAIALQISLTRKYYYAGKEYGWLKRSEQE